VLVSGSLDIFEACGCFFAAERVWYLEPDSSFPVHDVGLPGEEQENQEDHDKVPQEDHLLGVDL